MIPIYLVVAGSTTAFYFLTVALRRLIKKIQKRHNSQAANQEAANPTAPPVGEGEAENNEEKKKDHPCLQMFDGIMFLFLLGWFITGEALCCLCILELLSHITLGHKMTFYLISIREFTVYTGSKLPVLI